MKASELAPSVKTILNTDLCAGLSGTPTGCQGSSNCVQLLARCPQTTLLPMFLPCGVQRGLCPPLAILFPDAVGQLVPNGRHHLDELDGPVIQVQRSNSREVGAEVPVDPRALDAHEGSQVQAGPVRVCGRKSRVPHAIRPSLLTHCPWHLSTKSQLDRLHIQTPPWGLA